METLEKRLQSVLGHLLAEHVVLEKYNQDPFFFDEDDDSFSLQLVTNHLNMSELKAMNFYCSAFGLTYSVFYCPNISGQDLSIIIEDVKH